MADEWLTVDEAAKRLGLARRTIFHYVKTGKLQGYKAPAARQTVVRASDVDALKQPLPIGSSSQSSKTEE